MHKITCANCKKRLVKNDKDAPDKELVAVFSRKRPALCCNALLTFRSTVCKFCICYDCKRKIVKDDENKSKGRSKTRSQQKN